MIRHIYAISAMTVLEGLKNRALLGLLFLVGAAGACTMVIVPMFAFEQSKVFLDLSFSFIQISGLSIIFFLAITMVTQDIHQRSACTLLAGPIHRWEYLTGRFLGLAVVLFAVMAILFLVTCGGGLWALVNFTSATLPRNFNMGVLIIVFLMTYLSYLLLLAISFFFAVVTSNMYLAMLMTFASYIIGQSFETVIKIILQNKFVHLNSLYVTFLQILSWIVPNFRIFDLKTSILYGLSFENAMIVQRSLYGLSYIIFLVLLTCILFKNRDI